VHDVVLPNGPVIIKRYDPSKGENLANAVEESISENMLWRLANSLQEDRPVNVDEVYRGSYNTRSVLETLLAHSPQFYFCRPGRTQYTNGRSEKKDGHKCIVYRPSQPHVNGRLCETSDYEISDVSNAVVYQGLDLVDYEPVPEMTIAQKREHAKIQIALVLVGRHLGFSTWVAQNDRGIQYSGQSISDLDGVIENLADETAVSAYPAGIRDALFIDCIWFRNGRFMPAVMEIEHSTGITSGLNRMKGFYHSGPQLRDVRWTIVAPDEDREKVLRKAREPQFSELQTKYFSYSSVMELYSLCERRRIRGINDDFLDCFMEDCLAA
jgi:type II restriction enzyme